jgi:hypothetical protein
MTSHPWIERVAGFVPGFIAQHETLRDCADQCAIVLHGSTMMGIADQFSDIDLWLLLPDELHAQLCEQAGTGFFAFHDLHGKEGHLNAEPWSDYEHRLFGSCHMDTIYQLRSACVIQDQGGRARRLVDAARQPMRDEVRRVWFRYHYVEMRGEHRSCDNPIERNDPVALLLALTKTLRHAMQAATVWDLSPYPYDKWLYQAAQQGPVGADVCRYVRNVMDLIGARGLEQGGPESGNKIGLELRAIRRILVDAARADGSDQPWLDRWWEHMDAAREGIEGLPWT